jgi:hypothetical protein
MRTANHLVFVNKSLSQAPEGDLHAYCQSLVILHQLKEVQLVYHVLSVQLKEFKRVYHVLW